jgi:hypothetical protein
MDRFALIVTGTGKENIGKKAVFVDPRLGPWFDDIFSPTFSPDGKRFAYVAESGENQRIVYEGPRKASCPDEFLIEFNPQNEIVYFCSESEWHGWGIGTRPLKWYKRVYAPYTTADVSATAFWASDGSSFFWF